MKTARVKTTLSMVSILVFALAGRLNAQGMMATPEFLVTTRSANDFNTTLSKLKEAIEGQNLMVINEVNPQQMLRMVGMQTAGMRQVFFFHPRYMKRIIETNRNAGIEPPLKILVMETPDGNVIVRYEDPVHQFAPYDGLGDVAAELGQIVSGIVAAATS